MGIAIRQVCVLKSRKPADVAIAGGVSLAHQYRIESGERTADALYLVKVARFLNVSVERLLSPDSESTPSSSSQTINAPVVGNVSGGSVSINNKVKNNR